MIFTILGAGCMNSAQQVNAIHLWEFHVYEGEIEVFTDNFLFGFFSRLCRVSDVPSSGGCGIESAVLSCHHRLLECASDLSMSNTPTSVLSMSRILTGSWSIYIYVQEND
jgi:hypothetical protein